MKKINTKSFNVDLLNKEGKLESQPYLVRESMVEILFHPNLKLKSIDLIKQDELAKKIIKAKDELLLEDEEYARLKEALEKVEGLGRNDVEFVKRILDAESIDVKEE